MPKIYTIFSGLPLEKPAYTNQLIIDSF